VNLLLCTPLHTTKERALLLHFGRNLFLLGQNNGECMKERESRTLLWSFQLSTIQLCGECNFCPCAWRAQTALKKTARYIHFAANLFSVEDAGREHFSLWRAT